MKKITWPAWFSSPKGDVTAIFEKVEDVPAGWTSGAEKQTASGKAHLPQLDHDGDGQPGGSLKRGRPSRKKSPEPLDL